MSIFEAVKRWRLVRRDPDGSATYRLTSADGLTGFMLIGADGTRLTHTIDLSDAIKSAGPVMAPSEVTPPQPVQERVQDVEPAHRRESVAEPEPSAEPAPEPETKLHRDSKMMARTVWWGGGQRRSQLLHRMPTQVQQERLDYATKQGWITVSDDVVSPGSVNPVDVLPDTRSRKEKRLAWGPGPGRLW